MDEEAEINVEDLAADEIYELLLEADTDVSAAQAAELARLVRDAGGLDEAIEALKTLSGQRAA